MSKLTETNKAILRCWLEEFWNKGDESVADKLLSQDIADNPSGGQAVSPGAKGLKEFVIRWRTAIPGTMTIEEMIAERDLVAARLTWRGTHKGEFMGIPPTGKSVTITIMAFERIVDGKIVEGWGESNTLGLLNELGAIPPMVKVTS
jgi:steroid delta-isomerase-like uncharacterized protein